MRRAVDVAVAAVAGVLLAPVMAVVGLLDPQEVGSTCLVPPDSHRVAGG